MTRAQWALWTACVLVEAAVLVLAVLLARRDRAHVPVAVAFGFAVVADLAMRAGAVVFLDGAARPLFGVARTIRDVELALTAAWPALLAAIAWWAYVPSVRRAVPVVAAVAWGPVASWFIFYSPGGRQLAQRVLLGVELGAVGVAFLAIAIGWTRRRERPLAVVFALVAIELVVATVGPYARENPWDPSGDWDVARLLYLLGFGFIATVHVFWLRRSATAR